MLPRQGDWQVCISSQHPRDRFVGDCGELGGRRISLPEYREASIVPSEDWPKFSAATLEATSKALETLSSDAWNTIRLSLAEMLLTLAHQKLRSATEWPALALNRAAPSHLRSDRTQARRSRYHAGAGRADGGYLRALSAEVVEGTGDNFTHYLRERRLQHCWTDLANPAEAHRSVSDIAFGCGFSDAAHFSRSFRDRFGMSPRAFRQQQAERVSGLGVKTGQRGWPQDAVAQLRAHRPAPVIAAAELKLVDCAVSRVASLRIIFSPWMRRAFTGLFQPCAETADRSRFGDTITVETLTQHASDDPELMITGDPGAESVFRWTREGKGVERRGAGPMDASIYGRGAGEGFGVHICTGPIAVKGAEPGDVLEVRILDMVPRPSRNPDLHGRIFGSSVAAWWGTIMTSFSRSPSHAKR